jgi:hypothetical protein
MRNHARTLALCTLTGVLLAAPAAAQAQETTLGTPPPGETAAHHGRAVGGSGGGLGIGAASYVSGMAGPQAVYDAGPWHAELMLGFEHHTGGGGANPSINTFDFGLGGWYHLHAGDRSDFSIGGNLGFMVSNFSPGPSNNAIVIEPGVQVRVFVTDNVAVSGRVGLPIVFGDDINQPYVGELHEHFGLGGQISGLFGFAYFFR